MTSREVVAQGPPRVSLTRFPAYRISPQVTLFRAHGRARGSWWFSSDGGGRFDLPPPRGTCYLARDPLTAVREHLGVVLGSARAVPESALVDTVISLLRLPEKRDVADVQDRGAGSFGVTRELETMVPYPVPQAWARGWDDVGFGGVRYGPRFTPGDASAVALFDASGAKDWPEDRDPVAAQDVPGVPPSVTTPRRVDLNVVRPPRTRVTRQR